MGSHICRWAKWQNASEFVEPTILQDRQGYGLSVWSFDSLMLVTLALVRIAHVYEYVVIISIKLKPHAQRSGPGSPACLNIFRPSWLATQSLCDWPAARTLELFKRVWHRSSMKFEQCFGTGRWDDIGMYLVMLLDGLVWGPSTAKNLWGTKRSYCQVWSEGYYLFLAFWAVIHTIKGPDEWQKWWYPLCHCQTVVMWQLPFAFHAYMKAVMQINLGLWAW